LPAGSAWHSPIRRRLRSVEASDGKSNEILRARGLSGEDRKAFRAQRQSKGSRFNVAPGVNRAARIHDGRTDAESGER